MNSTTTSHAHWMWGRVPSIRWRRRTPSFTMIAIAMCSSLPPRSIMWAQAPFIALCTHTKATSASPTSLAALTNSMTPTKSSSTDSSCFNRQTLRLLTDWMWHSLTTVHTAIPLETWRMTISTRHLPHFRVGIQCRSSPTTERYYYYRIDGPFCVMHFAIFCPHSAHFPHLCHSISYILIRILELYNNRVSNAEKV